MRSNVEMDVSWNNLLWPLLCELYSFTQGWDQSHVFAWLDKVVGGDLSRSGHSTYDGVISLLLNFFCTFLTLAWAQSQSHTVWLLSWTCSLVVTLIVDEIWFFVALSSTLLGSELHGHTAVLLLELIKRQPVTSPADYSVANILSYISMSKSKSKSKSTWSLSCQRFILYQCPSLRGCGHQGMQKESETDRGGSDVLWELESYNINLHIS